MNILVTNDDGVNHPGIWALVRAVGDLGDVTVVAPDANKSGVGAGLSYRKPVVIHERESAVTGVPCYAVEGTPGDSVILGIKHVLGDVTDAVVSGINPGVNTSRNMLVSGTLGAAVTACSNGVKAAAFSMDSGDDIDDLTIKNIVRAITYELLQDCTPQASLFNINFPAFSGNPINGAQEAVPAISLLHTDLDGRGNGAFEIYSSLAATRDGSEVVEGTDLDVLAKGNVALTAVNGNNLSHIPNDPSLKRMIAAANSEIV